MNGTGADASSRPEGSVVLEAEAALFGFDASPVRIVITPRSRAWRIGGAARTMGGSLLVAPFVAIVPPHVVWLIGAISVGGFLARRRYIERFTLHAVDGACPKCGKPFAVKRARLQVPHSLPCDGCHHESALRLSPGSLEAIAVE